MALDFSAGSLVRSGSYIVLALLGGLLLARRSHHRWNGPVGAAYLLSGASGVVYNVLGGNANGGAGSVSDSTTPVAFFVTAGFSLLATLAWASIAIPLLRPVRTRPKRLIVALAVATAVLGIVEAFYNLGTEGGDALRVARMVDSAAYAILVPVALALLGMAAECARQDDRYDPVLLWLLVLPAVIELTIYAGGAPLLVPTVAEPLRTISVASYALNFVALLWLLRATGTRRGWQAVGMLGATLGAVVLVAVVGLAGVDVEARGVSGVLLLLADLAALYGILHFGLLGQDVRGPRRLGKGTLASLALAGLFITAQVAQNFLGARYGVYLGGVVAGVVVFAASPIQRAVERAVDAQRKGLPTSAAARYRRHVELAWADGRVGTKERLMLAEARESLGLDAAAALAIEDEVAAAAAQRKGKRTA